MEPINQMKITFEDHFFPYIGVYNASQYFIYAYINTAAVSNNDNNNN